MKTEIHELKNYLLWCPLSRHKFKKIKSQIFKSTVGKSWYAVILLCSTVVGFLFFVFIFFKSTSDLCS